MKLAVVGATGLVGQEILQVLAEWQFPFQELFLAASTESIGHTIAFAGRAYQVISLAATLSARPTIAIFSAGSAVALTWAPRFAAVGTVVIDNSAAWRMHPSHQLIVPEVNGELLQASDKIIANPNCSTIQLVMALAPLHRHYGLKRIVISTYQAVTGSGRVAIDQLMAERQGLPSNAKAYPHPIDLNLIPHIDEFLENGYTKEEMKLVNEVPKILGDTAIKVTATAVRVPVLGGHSLAVNVELHQDFELQTIIELLDATSGIVLQNDTTQGHYPMPMYVRGKDEVFVGRIRRDASQPCALNLWIVADNLRKGAATNAVQIAEHMYRLLTQ